MRPKIRGYGSQTYNKLEIKNLLQRDSQLPHEVGFAVGLAIDWKFECKFVGNFVEGVLRAVYSV